MCIVGRGAGPVEAISSVKPPLMMTFTAQSITKKMELLGGGVRGWRGWTVKMKSPAKVPDGLLGHR